MSKTLIIDDATARKIYPSADPELKAILEDSYGKPFFSLKITDRIKSFEDACEYNNTDPKARRFTIGTINQIYQERVAEIVKALNEGWVPNYNDSGEYKYTPYFYLDAPGFRFDDSYCTYTGAYTGTGSRFALKSRELADYAGRQFVKEYENWMTPLSLANVKSANVDCIRPNGDVKVRIKTFADACAELGMDVNNEEFLYGERDEIAYAKLKVITRALNQGWVPDWNNDNQLKWYPWFFMNNPGFRFLVSYYTRTAAYAGAGSRLRFASEELATYAGKQFLDLYRDYMTM